MVISSNSTFQRGAFNRKFFNKKLSALYHSQTMNGLKAICGKQKNHIYFETGTAGRIVEMDPTLSHVDLLKFQISNAERVQSLYTTYIDSSYCHIMAGNIPEIIQINLHDSSYCLFHPPGNLFSQSIVIDNSDYIFRQYQKSEGKWNQIFSKCNFITNTFIVNENVFDNSGDAGFSTDGVLLFDERTFCIIYVEYYRNKFICMDTLLRVLQRGQTIDTFSNVTIKVLSEKLRYSQTITNTSPLHEINLQSKAVNGKLYIHSAIRADNESRMDFSGNAVIDVYQIPDGHYLGSFYIPNYNDQRLKDFDVAADKILVLYDNYIVVYSPPFNL